MTTEQNPIDILSVYDKIKDNDFFKDSNLSDSDFDDMKLKVNSFKKGEIIFRLGDSADSIFLIIDGEIDLIKKQSFGKTQSCVYKNKFFGHEEYLLKTERKSIAIALKDSVIAELTNGKIELLLSRHSSILNNIKDSILDLDSKSISKFERTLKKALNSAEKPPSIFSVDAQVNNTKPTHDSAKQRVFVEEPRVQANDKNEPMKKEILKNINDYLSLLEEEKSELRALLTDYEINLQRLRNENEATKERESRVSNLNKEKNEILAGQSYRIVKLEKEKEEFKKLESEYLKKIELFTEQELNDKIRIKELETEVKANNKSFLDLNAAKLQLEQNVANQDQLLKVQKAKLENLEENLKNLTQDLAAKEKSLKELNLDIQNKNQQISIKNDNANEAKAEIENLLIKLENKERTIKNLSPRIEELQNKLDSQTRSEKDKNEDILNLSNKICEYEQSLKNYEKELSDKVETINDFAKSISELSETVRQKESEIQTLNDKIAELGSLPEDDPDTIGRLEIKIKENYEIREDLKELRNTLKNKDSRINELDSIVASLRIESSESREMKNELNSLKSEFKSLNNLHNNLIIENKELSEKVKSLKLNSGANEKSIENELSKIKLEKENYKNEIIEKDRIIKQLEERFEDIEQTKFEQMDSLVSKNDNYEEEIKKKDIQIAELTSQIKLVQDTLEEKDSLENQQAEIIENQAQKIAQLELLLNSSSVKDNDTMIIEDEHDLDVPPVQTDNEEQAQAEEEEEIFSKSKLITSKPVPTSMLNEGFEYYQHFDMHIVNVDLTRATMDVVSIFNELLKEIISTEKNKIIINLSKCEFIDSSIVGVLVSNIKKATAMGGDLKLVGLQPAVDSMMELTRMHRIFESFKTIDEAVASFD